MAIDNATIARRYGNALFEVAQEQNSLAETAAELNELKAALNQEPGFVNFMTSPQIDEKAKKDTLSALTANASTLVSNLLNMLFDYRRISNLEAIIDEFNRLYDQERKVVRAVVRTAVELDDQQKDTLAKKFAEVEGANKLSWMLRLIHQLSVGLSCNLQVIFMTVQLRRSLKRSSVCY